MFIYMTLAVLILAGKPKKVIYIRAYQFITTFTSIRSRSSRYTNF